MKQLKLQNLCQLWEFLLCHDTSAFHGLTSYFTPLTQSFICHDVTVLLTHLPRTKWLPFWQTALSVAFSWMESFVVWLNIHLSLFLRFQLTITSIGWDNGLAPNRWQAIISTNADSIHWRIYVALGGDKLNLLVPATFISVNRVCHPGGHCWDYYLGALSLGQITAIHGRYSTSI